MTEDTTYLSASEESTESGADELASLDDAIGLGPFFHKRKLKKSGGAAKKLGGRTIKTVTACEECKDPDGVLHPKVEPVTECLDAPCATRMVKAKEPQAGDGLGSFFTPRRKTKLAGRATTAGVNSPRMEKSSEDIWHQECLDSGTSSSSSAASLRAASRMAWKRRGLAENDGDAPAADVPEFEAGSEVEQQPCRGGSRASRDTGMYRAASRVGANCGRCHWLLPPESLLIRVDPITSEFLQRQWLALAQIKIAKSAAPRSNAASNMSLRMRPQGSRRRSFPAQLHAGWLAQTLRPRGWLAVIPEDEQKNLPMPVDFVSEPDRGPRRPCTAAVERVILQELGLGSCR
eukprot:CAMPEP_0172925510 /NCGR_PEP_ID=MMETSP1075-20121228/213848_1 /TAXON_ID=2916 /ORGANISM="Ceratium fusus, Strain PA161109" /LENGTH=346 /DNA_ID=CAMNT_0013786413 /DNA_START=32 /DNA_END=1072 /DNA_ORIENTATION=+